MTWPTDHASLLVSASRSLADRCAIAARSLSSVSSGETNSPLKSGIGGKAGITLKGKGANLELPALPFAQSPSVTAQLIASDGACWESVHDAPTIKNEAEQFKDKGELGSGARVPAAPDAMTVHYVT